MAAWPGNPRIGGERRVFCLIGDRQVRQHPVGQRNEVWRITPECPLPVAELSTVDLGGMQMA